MRYRFALCELDIRLHQLRREGTVIGVEPKVFDLLIYLLQHRDRLVSKNELLDQLWPGQVVGEATLTRCITSVRKAVGDDGAKQAIIETQHGRGYRFIAMVTEQSEAPISTSAPDGTDGVIITNNDQARDAVAILPSLLDGQATNVDNTALTPAPVDVVSPSSPGPPFVEPVQPRRVGAAYRSWPLAAFAGILLLAGVIVTVQHFPVRNPQPPNPSAPTPATPRQAFDCHHAFSQSDG
jgi:DNA-binding winged helix-turn-helix (wHTH) protein